MTRSRPRNRLLAALAGAALAAVVGLAAPPGASSLPGFPPTAQLAVSPNPALVGQTVTFDGSGSTGDGLGGTIEKYEWDLDGDFSFETTTLAPQATTSRSYDAATTITVRLRVTDSDGETDQDAVTLKVHNPPVASFTFSPPVPVPNQTITFDGSGSSDPDGPIAADDHDWDFDADGEFDDGEGQVVTHSFGNVGNHIVGLRVTDADGAVNIVTRTVRVNSPPSAGFIFEPQTPKINEPITFSSISSDQEGPIPAASHRWDFDADGQFDDAVGEPVTHSFSTPGTKVVGLEVTDSDGATTVTTRDVLVQADAPSASFDFSPNPPLSNETVTFDGSASTPPPGEEISGMSWDLDGDGAFDDGSGPTVGFSYPTPGPRTVRLQVDSSGGGFDITERVIVVGNRGPTASFNFTPESPRAGNTIKLTSTSVDPDGPVVSHEWDLDGDGQFDDANGPTAEKRFPEVGTFTVGLRVGDADGASHEATASVTVQPPTLDLLSPFPVVRIVGELRPSGNTEIERLSIRAPQGADVTLRCSGGSCPFEERTRAVKRVKVGFPGIERVLEPGVVIRIFVTEPDAIGKFTRFRTRDGKSPKRKDRCLESESQKPVSCPSTT